MAPHFKTLQWKRRRKTTKPTPFKTLSPRRWRNLFPSRTAATWTSHPCHFKTLTKVTNPLHHSHRTSHWDLHHFHHHHHCIHPESHLWTLIQYSSPEGRRRHRSEPTFIRPSDIDRGLTPSLSALVEANSSLAPYNLGRTAKTKGRQVCSTMRWLLSGPFGI